MKSLSKKFNDENDKKILMAQFGKKPKHRCPVCHRFSFWIPKIFKNGKLVDSQHKECVMCQLMKMTREEEKNGQGQNSKSKDIGE